MFVRRLCRHLVRGSEFQAPRFCLFQGRSVEIGICGMGRGLETPTSCDNCHHWPASTNLALGGWIMLIIKHSNPWQKDRLCCLESDHLNLCNAWSCSAEEFLSLCFLKSFFEIFFCQHHTPTVNIGRSKSVLWLGSLQCGLYQYDAVDGWSIIGLQRWSLLCSSLGRIQLRNYIEYSTLVHS